MGDIKVSALGSVYIGDKASWLEEALVSLLNQTRWIDEIVLVVDGPISKDVEEVIQSYLKHLTVVRLNENRGLAFALNCGIEVAKGDVFVRYDSDDLNDKERVSKLLKKHIELGPNYIIGSWVQEFGLSTKLRYVEEFSNVIEKQLGYRCVVNHPSVLYPKELISRLGGYQEGIFPEDYFLWLKARKKGIKFYNIPEVLVYMRTTDDFYVRRSGWQYAIKEYHFYKTAYSQDLLSFIEIFCSLPIRFGLRLMPKYIIRALYTKVLRR